MKYRCRICIGEIGKRIQKRTSVDNILLQQPIPIPIPKPTTKIHIFSSANLNPNIFNLNSGNFIFLRSPLHSRQLLRFHFEFRSTFNHCSCKLCCSIFEIRDNFLLGIDYQGLEFFSAIIILKKKGEFAGPIRAGSWVISTTALCKETCAKKINRGKQCKETVPKFLIASPTFHGGRGALPSAGGHPADLTFLAGGGC